MKLNEMLGFRPLLYLRLTRLPLVPYMRQWIGSALAQIMACRLFGAKPLSKPMLGYCQLDCQEQTSVKIESEFYHFHSRKCIWKCHLPEWRPFCPGGDELSQAMHSLRQLTHWGWDKMTAILQPFSHWFSCMKSVVFWFEFHRSLFPGVK